MSQILYLGPSFSSKNGFSLGNFAASPKLAKLRATRIL